MLRDSPMLTNPYEKQRLDDKPHPSYQPPPPPPPPPLPPVTFSALYLPFRSSQTLSKVTESPCWQFSSSGLSLTCAKQSSPPSSGVIKPKTFSWKKFFNVPVEDMIPH